MKHYLKPIFYLKCIGFLSLVPVSTHAQCELFKSEINGVETYMHDVIQSVDSVQTYAETAAFGATSSTTARANARKIEIMIGHALDAAEEAVLMVSESQYYSEVCGIQDVASYTIDAESQAIDARDFISEAFANVKEAVKSKNLGDIQYFMRKYQTNSSEGRNAAEDASYAAALAHASCDHDDSQAGR